MSYLSVQDWFQIQMRSIEEFIEKENTLRFVDGFVQQLELDKFISFNRQVPLINLTYFRTALFLYEFLSISILSFCNCYQINSIR